MNNYILSIPLALSKELVRYMENNDIDFEDVAYALESIISDAFSDAEDSGDATGDLEDNVSICVEGVSLDNDEE